MKTRTFTIIKPNAVAQGNTGKILDMILADGFTIRAMKMVHLSRNDASRFYAAHEGKPFLPSLIEFMTSGPVVAAVLEREDAVASLRKLVGDTDPRLAAEGTVRRLFGESVTRNAIHASDSDKSAHAELSRFFTESEIIAPDYSL